VFGFEGPPQPSVCVEKQQFTFSAMKLLWSSFATVLALATASSSSEEVRTTDGLFCVCVRMCFEPRISIDPSRFAHYYYPTRAISLSLSTYIHLHTQTALSDHEMAMRNHHNRHLQATIKPLPMMTVRFWDAKKEERGFFVLESLFG
jgi:hypothetical protein